MEEFYDRPINHDTLAEATEIIRQKVEDLRIKLNACLEGKGIKRRKRALKETEKTKAYNSKQHTFEKKLAERQKAEDDLSSERNVDDGGNQT